jgi:hypothetical protein
MSEAGGGDAKFVPTSFEDLRRDTRPDRADIPLSKTSSRDLHDLVAEGDFMRRSGLIAAGAVAFGVVLILIAYGRPILQTFDAFGTAGQVASDKASQQIQGVSGAVNGLASKAAFVKATDEKAINTAKGGLNCLAGKAACPNGVSPFR